MVDYGKKTVADLQEILKSRSLPSSGKKADLIARLQEADKAAESNEEEKAPPAPSTSAPPNQKPAPEPAPPVATKPAPEAKTPTPETSTAAETTKPSTDAAEAADSPSANTDSALASSAQYALNLPVSAVDDEMAKRKARAARFGTAPTNGETDPDGTEEKDDAAEKALERAQRFGTGQTAMGKLDQALPMERERGKKRNRLEEGAELEDPGLIRKSRGRGGFRGGFRGRRKVGGPHGGAGGARPAGVQKPSAYTSDKDKAAADARKARFANAS